METTNNSARASPGPNSATRRSGRVSKVPQKYQSDAPVANKRKRVAELDQDNEENESPAEETGTGSDDSAADDSSLEEAYVAKKKRPATRPDKARRKPAAKKAKTNGNAPVASSGHAPKRLPSRPKKTATTRLPVTRRDGHELYGKTWCTARVWRALC